MNETMTATQKRYAEEVARYETATPEARARIQPRLSRLNQMVAAEREKRSRYAVPYPCYCIK